MSKLNQNTYHTKNNQTCARTCNPGQHAAGIKKINKASNILFDSAQIAGVDYDEEKIDDENYDYEEEEDTNNNKDNNNKDYKYNKMDGNKLANILQEPNHFQVPHETEE